ncbi:UvrD-helicase domain-containing protein, partial [Methanobrevibacter sp.]
SYTDNISYDQVVSVDIKEDYKKEYDLTCLLLSFESSDDFDLGENKEIIHKFHDLYNNFDHIIDEINVEVKRRKSILDKLKKNKNNILNFIDCYMLNVSDELYIDDYQSILDENKYLYDICRDSEEIFDYKCITDFLNLYDRFESNAMFINEDYCDRKLDIFYDCENEIIEEIEKYENMDVDSYIKNRNDFLAKYKSINSLLSELLDLYEENDFKLDDDEFKTINSFIEIYDNINNYPEIKYAYFKENVLDRIELFVNKYSNVKECNKYIENKDNILNNFSDCFDFTNDILKLNNENDLKIKNKEKTSCNNFLTTYTNFDDYVLKNNLCYIKKIREKFDKENRKISAFVDKYDSNTIFNKFISKKEKKQILKKNKENYILISQMVKIDEIDNTPLMNDFMQIYENFDNIIFNFNKNYILNIYNQYEDDILVYSNIVKGQQDFYVSNRMLNKLIPKYDDILNIVKKLLDYCSQDNYLDNKENIEVFPKNLDVFTDSIKNANKKYVQREIINNKDFFDNIVPDKPLDDDQRKAVVTDEENTQIIAGAGSGKTLTLQAKAKYLIDKKHVDPSKILAISFSNASKNDLEYKMNEIDAPIDVKTFHSWGYEILKDCKYENSSFNKNSSNNLEVDEYALKKSIKKYFKNKILKDKIKMQKILEFFAYYIYEPLDKTKIDKIGEIYDYERGYDLKTFKEKFYKLRDPSLEKTTFKGETVKSLEERMIANFLFINGINYTYEKAWQPKYDWQETFDFCDKYIFEDLNLFDYFVIDDLDIFNELFSKYPNISDKWELNLPIDFKNYSIEGLLNFLNIDKVIYWPSGDEVVRNYNPDFYLNDYDIYLEHFGVNKKGFAPWLSRSASKTYHKEMINKKNLHKKYGTKLIETYSYYHSENRLLYCLEKILKEQGVDFKQVDYSNYFKKLLANESKISEYYDFIKLIESFINLFKGNDYKLDEFKVFRKINKENYAGFTYDRHELFFDLAEDIYQYYCQYLKDKNLIDFNDMINIANNYIKDNGYYKNYQYILVDEFQDTSHTRFNFLKSIKEATNAKLIIVGDDWQSIYSFTGCDIDLFTNFEKNINLKTEICYINNIYRYSQDLINVSSSFIMDNDKQIKKELTSKSNNLIKDSIKLYQYSNDELQPFIFEQIIKDILKSSNSKFVEILVLGRTNNDYKKIINEKLFYTQGIPAKKNFRIIYRKNPNIDIEYLTVHKSKGLERDNVVIINLEDKKNGFPNKMEDDSILSFVNIEINESMEFAEERRLFYVALTRTKERTYLLAPKDKKSIFVKEIMDDIDIVDVQLDNSDDFISDKAQVILSTEGFCPECGTGIINAIYNPKTNNKFYGCSNFPKCKWRGGNYLEDKELLKNPIKCDKCGGLIVKRVNSKDQTEFYACINYFSDKNCRRKYSKYRHFYD